MHCDPDLYKFSPFYFPELPVSGESPYFNTCPATDMLAVELSPSTYRTTEIAEPMAFMHLPNTPYFLATSFLNTTTTRKAAAAFPYRDGARHW